MMKIKKQKASRSKYQSINSSERALIIQYIEEYKYSASHVSMITGHNPSTIKAIYQVYKKEGRINKKVKRDKILNLSFQLMLFVADDIHGNLTKICVEQDENQQQIAEEEQLSKSNKHEQTLKQVLQQNKSKIVNLLDNQQAIDTFKSEMKIMNQQEFPSQYFLSLKQPPRLKYNERQQEYFGNKKNQKLFLNLISEKQENAQEDERNKLVLVKKLNEQFLLMKM